MSMPSMEPHEPHRMGTMQYVDDDGIIMEEECISSSSESENELFVGSTRADAISDHWLNWKSDHIVC